MSTPELDPQTGGYGTLRHLGDQLARALDFAVRNPGVALQRLLAAAIAVSVAMVAGHFLPELARRALPAEYAWTLFMITEALAALGLITWRTSPHRVHRVAGLTTTMVALAASVAGMVTAHVTRALPPELMAAPATTWWFGWRGWDVGVVVIAAYPIAFVTSLHLLLGGKVPDPPPERDSEPTAEQPTGTPRRSRTRTRTVTAPQTVPPPAVPEPVTDAPDAEPDRAAPPIVTAAPAAPSGDQVADAAALGVTIEPAPEGETPEERDRRLARNRKRLQRARRARSASESPADVQPTTAPDTDTEHEPVAEPEPVDEVVQPWPVPMAPPEHTSDTNDPTLGDAESARQWVKQDVVGAPR